MIKQYKPYFMKKLFLLFYYFPVLAFSQVQDDFSDGNFSQNPSWTGDSIQFEINTENRLHLLSSGSDTSFLATENSRVRDTEWNFWVKLSFNTSTNNFARYYLVSDREDLDGQLQGYFVQVGGSHDSLLVFRQDGTTLHQCYGFHLYRTSHSTNALRIKVTCDESGQWEAYIDTTGGFNYTRDGGFFDAIYQTGEWSGVYCKYTSSNATRFYFDDIYIGPIIHDRVPPRIDALHCIDDRELEIVFSENVDRQSAENKNNYFLFSAGKPPDSVCLNSSMPFMVRLKFGIPFPEGIPDSLRVRGILDLSGNSLPDTLVPVLFYEVKAFDIVIQEILADPEPVNGLPPGEFIELHNRTAFPINLENWEFKFGNSSKRFSAVTIQPKGFLVIAKDSLYSSYGPFFALFTSGSSISNEGTTLVLKDSKQHFIHAVTYTPDWFRDSFKEDGGWSLEMKDEENFCGCFENWDASSDPSGGTPGRVNSIQTSLRDVVSPYMKMAFITDSSELQIEFSESIDSLSLSSLMAWELEPGFLHPNRVFLIEPHYDRIKLHFNDPFLPGQVYRIKTGNTVHDCAGNKIDTTRIIRFAIPDTLTKNEVIINEILANPKPGGVRFVELYNRSGKVIDLNDMVMAGCDTTNNFPENVRPVTNHGFLLFPGEYMLLTPDPDQILEQYYCPDPDRVIKMVGFPSLDEDTGTIVVARKDNLQVIDRVRYSKELHFALLVSTDGVSLERVNADRPSTDVGNWHSAAETVGFATPAYQNSQWMETGNSDQFVTLDPEIFSPDNDGREDILNISFNTEEGGYVASIEIFNARGSLIRRLVNNALIPPQSIVSWDGFTDLRTKAPVGFYILFIELIKPDGKVMHWKKVTVIAGKF